MRGFYVFCWFTLVILCFTGNAWSSGPSGPLSFADSLYAEGDYYRAITEYKRFLHSSPEHPLAPHAALRVAQAYLAGERWPQAEAALKHLQKQYPHTAQSEQALLLAGDSALQQQKYSQAVTRYLQAAGSSAGETIRQEAQHRAAWAMIEQDRYDEARQLLTSLEEPALEEIAGQLHSLEHLPRKSPGLAGALSAALPGAGQLYAGRPREAGLSLLLNAAFILGAVESFENDQNVLGGILLFFEFGWYTGNIYNAVNSTHKYNRDLRRSYKSELRKDFGLRLGIAEDGTPIPGLQLTF